jgi:3'-phosphoadenosine 5'-phosphosulfate sulfotransferase (PAPS reductase)/FAD synthetase
MTPDHARLHTRLQEYRRRVQVAIETIDRAMRLVSMPYVACSFGKDSAVLLHLVHTRYPHIDARFLRWQNETEHLDTYPEVVERWMDQFPRLRIVIVSMERTLLSERGVGRFDRLATVHPSDSAFIGLRAEESRGRRMTLRTHGTIYRMASGMTRICPLAWWSTADIAAYVVTNDLPTLATYHEQGFTARTSSRIPRDAHGIRAQSLAWLRRVHPDRFAALQEVYPEVSAYV